jgi:hypothetical protein
MIGWCMAHPFYTFLIISLFLLVIYGIVEEICSAIRSKNK